MKISKKVLALCVAMSVGSALFADIIVDAALALPITGNKTTIKKVEGEKVDDCEPVNYSSVGLGFDINAIMIEKDAFMGIGATLGFNIPLSLKSTYKNGDWYKISHSKYTDKDGSTKLPDDTSWGAFGIDALVGPALRLFSNDKMNFFVTPGLYLGYVSYTTKMKYGSDSAKDSNGFFDLGLGVNASFSYDITDKFFVKAGLLGEIGFAFENDNYSDGSSSSKSSGNGLSYGFRPQIGAGYKF